MELTKTINAKGYKQTEVGLIPEDWEVKNLGEVLTFGSGRDYKNLQNGEIPVYGTGGIMTHVNDFLYDGESVGIGRKGTIDKPVFLTGKFWTVDTLFYSYNFINSNPKFVFYNFCLIKWKEYNEASGVPSLNKKTIEKIQIPLPPLSEQKAIAAALSDVDALLLSLDKQITKKKAIKQGAMQELLTPKEGWELKSLGEILIKNPDYGINAASVEYNDKLPTYLRITDISEDGKYLKNNKVSVDNIFSENFELENGDLVFARTGASVGKTYLYNQQDGKLIFAGFLIRVKPNLKLLNPTFLFFITQTKYYTNWILTNSMRSGQPGINSNEIKSFVFNYPPIKEQTRISQILSDMNLEITSLEAKRQKYVAIKQGMMQELLTGRTRLV